MRPVAKQKTDKLWHQRKEMEQAKAEAEWKKQEEIKMEQERKRQKEIELANQQKLHEEKLKNELRLQIQLKCQKEKEMVKIKSIEEKFGFELELQVRKEMGLPTKKLPVPHLPELIPGMSANPGSFYVTPSSIVGIKKEKLEPDAYADPSTPTRCGDKRKDTERHTTSVQKICNQARFSGNLYPLQTKRKVNIACAVVLTAGQICCTVIERREYSQN